MYFQDRRLQGNWVGPHNMTRSLQKSAISESGIRAQQLWSDNCPGIRSSTWLQSDRGNAWKCLGKERLLIGIDLVHHSSWDIFRSCWFFFCCRVGIKMLKVSSAWSCAAFTRDHRSIHPPHQLSAAFVPLCRAPLAHLELPVVIIVVWVRTTLSLHTSNENRSISGHLGTIVPIPSLCLKPPIAIPQFAARTLWAKRSRPSWTKAPFSTPQLVGFITRKET